MKLLRSLLLGVLAVLIAIPLHAAPIAHGIRALADTAASSGSSADPGSLVSLIIPAIIAAIVGAVWPAFVKAQAWITTSPLHAIISTVGGAVFTAIAAALHVTIQTSDPGILGKGDVQVLFGGIVALIVHVISTLHSHASTPAVVAHAT
ncbi:MAG TPA: hypothetical protein VGM20_04315 [Gemmatimonadales bacterium]|jgi:hypothetical protein